MRWRYATVPVTVAFVFLSLFPLHAGTNEATTRTKTSARLDLGMNLSYFNSTIFFDTIAEPDVSRQKLTSCILPSSPLRLASPPRPDP